VCLLNVLSETNLKVRQALVETAEMGEDTEQLSAFDGIVDSQSLLQHNLLTTESHLCGRSLSIRYGVRPPVCHYRSTS